MAAINPASGCTCIPKDIDELIANREKFVAGLNQLAEKSTRIYQVVIVHRDSFPDSFLVEALDSRGLTDRALQILLSEYERRGLGAASGKIDRVASELRDLKRKAEKENQSAKRIKDSLAENQRALQNLEAANRAKDDEIRELESETQVQGENLGKLVTENGKLSKGIESKKSKRKKFRIFSFAGLALAALGGLVLLFKRSRK